MADSDVQRSSVTSSGLVAGDNPLKHSLLLLIVQIFIILCFSRFISLLFRPLRQPRVIAEIIAGILLGPTALGQIPGFSKALFPESSQGLLETVAEFGLIFFLFLVGLELDVGVLRKSGSTAVGIAAAGIGLPFTLAVPASLAIFNLMGLKQHGLQFGLPYILFIGVSFSITAFPVLARILAERKILNTEIGQMAVSAAALNDVVAWALLALAVAVTNKGSSPLVVVWVLLLGVVFVVVMFTFGSPLMHSLAKREPISEIVVAIVLLFVLVAAFTTDAIGIHVIFGAFIVGLLVPKDRPLSGVLIEKIEDFVTILLLPLYFTSSGLKTDLTKLNTPQAGAVVVLVACTAMSGKVLGTVFVTRVFKKLPFRKCFSVGFLMSTKGLVDLIVLNIGLSKGVIDKELFASLVLVAIITTSLTTPMIMWLYKPARDIPPYKRRKLEANFKEFANEKLCILVCLHGSRNLPGMLNMINMSKGRRPRLLKVNVLHLIEFSERSSAIRIAATATSVAEPGIDETDLEDDAPFTADAVGVALRTFGQVNNVKLRVNVAVSGLSSMHEDICSAAGNIRANIIILPFHKYQCPDGSFESMGAEFFHVNYKVMKESPCSVAILVDHGLDIPGTSLSDQFAPHVLVLFFGGPDDREALLFAQRMLDNGGISKLTVVQCVLRERQPPAPLSRLGTEDLREYIPEELTPNFSVRRCGLNIRRWGKRCLRWLRAPWNGDKLEESKLEESDTSSDMPPLTEKDNGPPNPVPPSNEKQAKDEMTTENDEHYVHRGASLSKTDDAPFKVSVNQLDEENEKKMDVKVFGPLLAAAKRSKDLSRTDESKRITVNVVEMDDPSQAMEGILIEEEYELIICGLHLDYESVVQRSGRFRSGFHQGLGPVGDMLASMEMSTRSRRSSVLVVRQHRPAFDESLGGMSDLSTVDEFAKK